MALLALLIALFCVCAYSILLTLRFHTPSGAAPLGVLCGTLLWFCAAGYAGFLQTGGALWYLGGAAAAVLCAVQLKKAGVGKSVQELLTPGFVLFAGGSFVLILVLFLRRPVFTFWDEFSFWGTAAKLTKLHNALYPAVESSLAGKLAYPPAIPLAGYFAQFLAPEFTDWAAMAGYDMVVCACLAAVLSGLPEKRVRTGILAGAALAVLPFLFETAALTGGLVFVYRTLLSETFLGCLFGAAMAVWFSQKEKTAGTALRFTLVLTVLGLTKDVGIVLSLAAMMIAGIDLLVFSRKNFRFGKLRGFWAIAAALALVVLLGLTAYPGWNAYFASAAAIDRTAGDGAAGLTMGGVVVQGMKELLGIGRTEQFAQVLRNMAGAYFSVRVSAFGSGFVTTGVIFAVCLLAFFARPKGSRAQTVVFFGTGCAGLGGMMIFLLFAYVYVFDAASGLSLIDYSRYIGLYYLGWMLGAFSLLIPYTEEITGHIAVPVCAAAVCALCMLHMPLSRTLFAPGIAQSDMRSTVNYRAAEAAEVCGREDKVFIVSQFDDARRYYQYVQELEPVRVLPMIGGTLAAPGSDWPEAPALQTITPEELRSTLQKQGCTYLLIDQAGEYDTQGYTALFTDELRGYYENGVRLYRASEHDGVYAFEPCGKAGALG